MFGIDTIAARIVGGILLVLAIFGYGYYRGHNAVTLQFDRYKAEVTAAADQQAKETAKIDAKNKKLLEETKNAYSTSIANLRTYYQLRIAKSGGTMPSIADTTSGIAGYSPDNLPPASILAAQCAETTLTLISLQNWAVNVQKTYQ